MNLTYGAELEWPDVDPLAELPPGWAWSRTDYTIVNSDGTANDPSRSRDRLPFRGGELNTPPADSPAALAAAAAPLWKALQPGYNYRSNLHIHIGLTDGWTLDRLKRLADFTRAWLPPLLPVIDPLDGLLDGIPPGTADHADAMQRLRHSQRSRHYLTSRARHLLRMTALTVDDALAAECPTSRDGTVQWHLASREAVNLRAIRKHGTVEFRLFAGPRTPDQLAAAAELAGGWVEHALTETDPTGMVNSLAGRLPRQAAFDPALERGWAATNLHTNRRADVRRRAWWVTV